MQTQGLSTLELRSIIEHGFLPLQCQCSIAADQSLTVRVVDAASGHVDLLVTGIATEKLDSCRAISDLVAELLDEMAHHHKAPPVRVAVHAG